jgi:hypothetical protein
MTLALASLAILAVILVELLWLLSLTRVELETGTATSGGPKEALLRKALGVTLDGRLAKRREMRGRRAGRDFVIRWRASVAPPWGGAEEDVTCVEVAPAESAPSPPFLVVAAEDADRTAGSTEAGAQLSPVRTGHASFDDAFALLAPEDAGAPAETPEGAPFRSGSQRIPSWASIDRLDRLVAVKPRWLQVQEGRVTLAIAVGEPDGLVDAVRVAWAIAGIPEGSPAELVPVARAKVRRQLAVDVAIALVLGFSAGLPVLFGVSCAAPLGSITAPVDCGKGHPMGVHSAPNPNGKGGTSYNMACLDDVDRTMTAHWLVTLAMFFALLLLAMIVRLQYRRYLRGLEAR